MKGFELIWRSMSKRLHVRQHNPFKVPHEHEALVNNLLKSVIERKAFRNKHLTDNATPLKLCLNFLCSSLVLQPDVHEGGTYLAAVKLRAALHLCKSHGSSLSFFFPTRLLK